MCIESVKEQYFYLLGAIELLKQKVCKCETPMKIVSKRFPKFIYNSCIGI